ncbi:MAG: hypothetical protein J5959_00990 [Butyrivibrio sp.]|nr:hypothetical protein [Butyrivibrio sp.]MBP3239863.1 hypothetical protein [Oribacterium sp.]
MIGKYKDKYYSYIRNSKAQVLVTRSKKKADGIFEKDDGAYVKKVKDEDLSDIFEVKFRVEYDAKLQDTPLWWNVFPEDFTKFGVNLVFAEGFLPNWKVVDKFVCKKFIPYIELGNCEVVYKYIKKDGIVQDITESTGIVSVKEMLRRLKEFRQYER